MKWKRYQGGFTLVELMVVVAIVAVLAAVGYPSYQNYVLKANRSAAQSFMMQTANAQQQYLLDARQYALGAGFLATLSVTAPTDFTKFYALSVTPASATTPPSFTLVATPAGSQVADGILTLDNLGAKTRNGVPGW